MGYDRTPGNLYWDERGGYILCLITKKGRKRVLTYPYSYLHTFNLNSVEILVLGEHCEMYYPGEDDPLKRSGGVEYLGRVGKDLMLQPEPDSLFYERRLKVCIPKRFQTGLGQIMGDS